MREYLLAWRALPKLVIGEIFVLEILLILLGGKAFLQTASAAFSKLKENYEGATLLVSVILLLMIAASLGLFALNTLSAVARTLARTVIKILPPVRRSRSFPMRELFENPHATAMRILTDKGEFYADVAALKSSSYSLEALEKAPTIKQHFSAARLLLAGAQVYDIESVVFQSALSQERRTSEIIMDEIQVLENLVLVLLLAPVAFIAADMATWPLVGLIALTLIMGAALLPEIAYRKRFLGGFILATALEIFAVNEGAEVADREGEPFA